MALLAVLYLWVFPYHPAVNNPNENVRLYMTVALVDDHTFAINRVESTWGYTNDKSIVNGRLFSSKAPGTSYLGVPFYWALTKITGRHALPPPPEAAPPARANPAAARPLLDRTRLVYFLRLCTNVLPGLVFAWFWHRFLGRQTRSRALRESVFFATMAGSSLFAYSEVFAGHAHNAFCLGAAMMALCAVSEGDREALNRGATRRTRAGLFFLAGLFGAACTMFEYPAATATLSLALWIAALGVEQRKGLLWLAGALLPLAATLAVKHHPKAALACAAGALGLYAATLSWQSVARLASAGVGGAIPTGLTLFYHHRCFGSPFKPGYSYLENPQFREETSQGFFGATQFSWEAGLRLWFDPAFGLVPSTAIFVACVWGFGAYLKPVWLDGALSPQQRLRRDLASALLGAIAVGTLAKMLLVGRAHSVNHDGLHAALGPWVVAFLAALLGAAILRARVPLRPNRALGAVMLLSTMGITRLIGMMNNWRGGWQVGPRYLVTLVPVLGLTALAALDGVWRAEPRDKAWARPAVTALAAGGALSSMLLTGLASAWFPHIPVEYTAPFFEMVLPLLRSGYVPHNAGHFLFHLEGLRAMWGFFLAFAVIAAVLLRGDARRPLAVLAQSLATLAFTLLFLVPSALAVRPENAAVTRYVKSAFEPALPRVTPPSAQAIARERVDETRARARRLAEAGDSASAMTAWLRAMQQSPGR